MQKFKPVNLKNIKTYSAKQRKTKVTLDKLISELPTNKSQQGHIQIAAVAKAIARAHKTGRPVIWGMGAHVIKVGLSPIICQMIRKGLITCVAMNGAGAIHDFELATLGTTSEDVAENLKTGMFGMVRETLDNLNAAINQCKSGKIGIGEAVGKYISKSKAPYKDLSILAAAYEMGIPATVHVAIGTDTIHMSPKMDAAAAGLGSHHDFKLLCAVVVHLEGGVYINAGSAVVLPEVFLKALTVARNLGNKVNKITTVNMDMLKHYRPRVNVVERPNLNGGKGYNIIGKHEENIPGLWKMVINML
ncbi:MAG: hypothetical protein WC901_00170 [Candidatus Margulisiibacteriota bacterium]